MKKFKFFLNDDVRREIYKWIQDKIDVNSVAFLYYSSQLFNLSKPSLCFIERCFPMFVDSHNFLELDVMSVARILSSSELNVDSELQVFNAADAWLANNKEGDKHVSYIFSKIRFSLLSVPVLNYISNNNMCLNAGFGGAVLDVKEVLHSNKYSSSRRYCSQTNFDLIVCGGMDKDGGVSKVHSINSNKKFRANDLPKLRSGRSYSRIVGVKGGELYLFGGVDLEEDEIVTSIEKYSPSAGSWETVAEMVDGRCGFSACSFMDQVYIIGGCCKGMLSSCFEFDTKNKSWTEHCGMNEARAGSACAVFQGKVVVSGGMHYGNYDRLDHKTLNSVEAYDHVDDAWTYMPDLIKRRYNSQSAAVRNKLFVIGGYRRMTSGTESLPCEVFDSTCGKFVLLKSPPTFYDHLRHVHGFASVGGALVVIGASEFILFYDVAKDEWTKQLLGVTEGITRFCCVKVPQLQQTDDDSWNVKRCGNDGP